MKPLHPWKVSIEEAIRIQKHLRPHLILKNTFLELRTIGGADVAYSKDETTLSGAIAILSFPELRPLDFALIRGNSPFPYVPGLFAFREGPILIRAFRKLRIKPDLMIFDGQGIAHPRGLGLASHMGLWFDLPSIGCGKTYFIGHFFSPGLSKGNFEWIEMEGNKVGAVLRTKDNVRPLFISPGHRIDLMTSIQIILKTCKGYRIPEPLRRAHHLSREKQRGQP